MRNFFGTLGTAAGNLPAIVAIAVSATIALTGVVLVSSLTNRIQKLEADFGALRSDLEHPRVKPLASLPDALVRAGQ